MTQTDYQSEEYPNAWLCVCGHYELTEFHCPRCGHEPPWGCTCELCIEKCLNYDNDDIYWIQDLGGIT